MPKHFGPIEINCDAPPYHIVRACSRVGIQSPEDVRWCRLSNLSSVFTGLRKLLNHTPWATLFKTGWSGDGCFCGDRLPVLEQYTFTLLTGKEISYLLGQCRRCRAVFWEET